MRELRGPSLRLAAGLAVGLVGLLEVLNLAQTLSSQARLRSRVVRSTREAVTAAQPRLERILQPGDMASWHGACEEALRSALASEVEVFDGAGTRLLACPARAPVEHWPDADALRALQAGEVLSVGPVAGEGWRVLGYAAFGGAHPVVIRFASPAPDVVEDLQERRGLLVAHAVALVLLMLAGGLVLLPGAPREEATGSGALHAYEVAMARLRDRGQAASLEHQAERRRMEEQIRDHEAFARAGELTAGIVHEVRNGLGTILGYARLIEGAGPTAESAEPARRVREECEALEALIRRFMDFVRRETLVRAPFDLARTLGRVAAREMQRRDLRVELETPGDGGFVGDEEMLERALENLVRNACDAAGPGGRVTVRLERSEHGSTVEIEDDGPGLSAATRRNLRPFFTTKAGGLGLGLAIALKIVRLHDGELEFADAEPRGLIVRVRLPAAMPPPEPVVTDGIAGDADG